MIGEKVVPASAFGGRILLLDDDQAITRGLARIFRRYELTPVVAASLGEGLAAILREPLPIAGAVIDIRLPDGSGLDVIRALRRRAPYAPILVLSADNAPATINAANAQAVEFAVKPCPPDNLHAFARRLATGDERRRDEARARVDAFALARGLTEREHEVLSLTVSGVLRCSLAIRMKVAESTVKTHINELLRKSDRYRDLNELALAVVIR